MNRRTLWLLVAVVLAMSSFSPIEEASASGPVIARGALVYRPAEGPVIATGAQRTAIKSQHILNRPDRPLHVYGNTVRRRQTRHR